MATKSLEIGTRVSVSKKDSASRNHGLTGTICKIFEGWLFWVESDNAEDGYPAYGPYIEDELIPAGGKKKPKPNKNKDSEPVPISDIPSSATYSGGEITRVRVKYRGTEPREGEEIDLEVGLFNKRTKIGHFIVSPTVISVSEEGIGIDKPDVEEVVSEAIELELGEQNLDVENMVWGEISKQFTY